MKPQDGLVVLRGALKVMGKSGQNIPEQAQRLATYGMGVVAEIMRGMAADGREQGGSPGSEYPDFSKSSSTAHEKKQKKDLIGFPERDVGADGRTSSSARASILREEKENLVARRTNMRENAVPSTRFDRVLGFGALGAQLAFGMAGANISRLTGIGASSSSSSHSQDGISDANAEILAEALCRMRGAALKLGQMMSIQDTDGYLPPALEKALARVRESADYMPRAQLERQLVQQLGPDWRAQLGEFEHLPIAAASIGQVHRATLKDGTEVVLKVQYPGVAGSIESDLRNLKMVVTALNALPKGLYIDEIMRVAGGELKEECDYITEAASQARFAYLIAQDDVLADVCHVPRVIESLSTDQVLTTEFVHGITLDKAVDLDQSTRDAIARTILFLTIRELFEWRFMQTDPNFANFLFDRDARLINLIDFGASRAYEKPFVDGYMRLVWAAASRDEDALLDASRELGFLTGDEAPEMVSAHIEAAMVVGEPFNTAPGEAFDFAGSKLTQRIGKHGATFVKHRLVPPPPEAYSLHRKLAGAFLLCIKLRAKIHCRDILEMTYANYDWSSGSGSGCNSDSDGDRDAGGM